MRREEMSAEAAKCRQQAQHFELDERDLLLKMARAFDEMAIALDAREAVARHRCW